LTEWQDEKNSDVNEVREWQKVVVYYEGWVAVGESPEEQQGEGERDCEDGC
jgi:hypothetical protein